MSEKALWWKCTWMLKLFTEKLHYLSQMLHYQYQNSCQFTATCSQHNLHSIINTNESVHCTELEQKEGSNVLNSLRLSKQYFFQYNCHKSKAQVLPITLTMALFYSCPYKSRQCTSTHNTRTFTLKQLNGRQPSLILLITPVHINYTSAVHCCKMNIDETLHLFFPYCDFIHEKYPQYYKPFSNCVLEYDAVVFNLFTYIVSKDVITV